MTKIKQGGIADLAVGQSQIAADAVTAAKIVDGAVGAAEIDAGAVGTSEIADGTVGAGDLAATLDLSSKTLTMPAANTPAFTKSYESAQQTITAGGSGTLAHGLGVKPKILQATIVCTTTDLNYAVNDEVVINPSSSTESALDCGIALFIDATNIGYKIGGNATSSISIINKTNGNHSQITNASWKLVVRAWA